MLVQRVVYHCSEGNCRCGRGIHVVEFVTRVGMDGDVKRESAVSDIQPRSGVCPCNYSRWRAKEEEAEKRGKRGEGEEEEEEEDNVDIT